MPISFIRIKRVFTAFPAASMACSHQAGEVGFQPAVPKVWSHLGETVGRADESDSINAHMDRVEKSKGAAVTLGKFEERRDIKGCGAMRTPGVAICGKVVLAGVLPSREKIDRWLSAIKGCDLREGVTCQAGHVLRQRHRATRPQRCPFRQARYERHPHPHQDDVSCELAPCGCARKSLALQERRHCTGH